MPSTFFCYAASSGVPRPPTTVRSSGYATHAAKRSSANDTNHSTQPRRISGHKMDDKMDDSVSAEAVGYMLYK